MGSNKIENNVLVLGEGKTGRNWGWEGQMFPAGQWAEEKKKTRKTIPCDEPHSFFLQTPCI